MEAICDLWFPVQRTSNAKLWCFLYVSPNRLLRKTIVLQVIWDASHFIVMRNRCRLSVNTWAAGYQYPQCWVHIHYIRPVSYENIAVIVTNITRWYYFIKNNVVAKVFTFVLECIVSSVLLWIQNLRTVWIVPPLLQHDPFQSTNHNKKIYTGKPRNSTAQ